MRVEAIEARVVGAGDAFELLDVNPARSFHRTGSGGDPTCADLMDSKGWAMFQRVVRAPSVDLGGVPAGTVKGAGGMPVADAEVWILPAGAAAGTEPVAITPSSPAGLAEVPSGCMWCAWMSSGTPGRIRPAGRSAPSRAIARRAPRSGPRRR